MFQRWEQALSFGPWNNNQQQSVYLQLESEKEGFKEYAQFPVQQHDAYVCINIHIKCCENWDC